MPTSDVFRPRLPLDPFAAIDNPWHLHLPTLPPTVPNVVLVLGAPSPTDLAPLTTSPNLSHSLLILAAHTPPPISTASLSPAIIILRLPAPLAVHDAGALRLVSLLQRAQRVAYTWHSTRHSHPRILQLAEDCLGGEFTRHEPVELAVQVPPPRRLSPLSAGDNDTLPLSPTVSASSVARVKFSSAAIKKGTIPFTALFNFLPPTLPDKALLKHTVLVTTLSAPFLNSATAAATAHPPPAGTTHSSTPNLSVPSSDSRRRSRLSSLFTTTIATPSTSVESLSLAKRDTIDKAHIVHILPHSAFFPSSLGPSPSTLYPPSNKHRRVSVRGVSDPGMGWATAAAGMLNGSTRKAPRKSKLVQSIEHFLLSHAYPLAPTNTDPSAPSSTASSIRSSRISKSDSRPTSICSLASISDNSWLSQGQGRVVPFLVPVGVLGTVPRLENATSMSIGEMMVLGVLDDIANGWKEMEGHGVGCPRAWIGDGGDVVVSPPDQNRLEVPLVREDNKGTSRNLNEAGLPTPPASLEGGLTRSGSGGEERRESRPSSSVSSRSEEAWVGSKGERERKWSVVGKEKGKRDEPGLFDAVVKKNVEMEKKKKLKNRMANFFKLGRRSE